MIIDINAFNAVQPALDQKNPRECLKAVHIEDTEDKRIYVGTDGHIMLIVETPLTDERLKEPFTVLTPKQIPATLDRAELVPVDNETVVIKTNKGKVALDVCDSTYPDWRKVVPSFDTPHATKYMSFQAKYLDMMNDFIDGCNCIRPRCADYLSAAMWVKTLENGQKRIGVLMPCKLDKELSKC